MLFARTFFLTTNTWQRTPIFRNERKARLFVETLYHYRDQGKFLLHEFVLMPDHFHALITPAQDISLERAVQFIKGGFSHRLGRSKIPVWQPSFANHHIRDETDFAMHRAYIHNNPVRAQLAITPEEYPYSSANSAFRLVPHPPGLKPPTLTKP